MYHSFIIKEAGVGEKRRMKQKRRKNQHGGRGATHCLVLSKTDYLISQDCFEQGHTMTMNQHSPSVRRKWRNYPPASISHWSKSPQWGINSFILPGCTGVDANKVPQCLTPQIPQGILGHAMKCSRMCTEVGQSLSRCGHHRGSWGWTTCPKAIEMGKLRGSEQDWYMHKNVHLSVDSNQKAQPL